MKSGRTNQRDYIRKEAKKESAITILAKAGALLNERDRYGFSPLHYAALRGNELETRQLLMCEGTDVEVLIAALINFHHVRVHSRRLAMKTINTVHAQIRDEQLLTPLHLACSYGQIEEAAVLLEFNARIDAMGYRKQTALHKACSVGEKNLVALLVEYTLQVYGN